MSQLAPQLRALEELDSQDGHMTRAADSLGIPQSSMSRRIHALEKALGVRLLIQEGRTVRLTPAAVRLAEQARRPLRELEVTVETIAGEADPEHGTIRFGFPLTMGAGVVPSLIAEFHRRAPGIRLQIKQAHGSELAADLKAGTLDVAVVIPPPGDVDHVVIGGQQIRPCCPRLIRSPRVVVSAWMNCGTRRSSPTRPAITSGRRLKPGAVIRVSRRMCRWRSPSSRQSASSSGGGWVLRCYRTMSTRRARCGKFH